MWRKMVTMGTLAGLAVSGSAAGRIHTVRRGDTLEAIGRRYGVAVPALVAANGLRHPDLVWEGAALTIPVPAAGPSVPAAAAAPRRAPVGLVAGAAPARRPPGRAAVPARPVTTKAGALREIVVRMPPAQLAAARTAPRIAVPPDRAGLRPAFLRFSQLAGVPSDLAMALAWQESGWQRNKVSSTRAVGVMQLMPDTVDFVSTSLIGTAPLDPRDPVANIRMGTRFLRYLLDSHGGSVDRALASYYQGLRSVRERGLLDETQRFVANVKALRGRL
jgi:soluble lytic murein transglycosylase-like protein